MSKQDNSDLDNSMQFKQWMEAEQPKRIYDIRLNPEDAKYGVQSKQRRQEIQSAIGWSQLAIDAWKAAVDSTRDAILKTYTPQLRQAEAQIREDLPERRAEARCTRCGGKGYRDEDEKWIQFRGKPVGREGFKGCFKCSGSGIETKMEPVFFRRRVVDYIKQKVAEQKLNEVKAWAEKVKQSNLDEQPYRPMLMDIVQLIDENRFNEIGRLPH
jgi:hypothetical protein